MKFDLKITQEMECQKVKTSLGLPDNNACQAVSQHISMSAMDENECHIGDINYYYNDILCHILNHNIILSCPINAFQHAV